MYWNKEIEYILEQIGTKSYDMSNIHKKNYIKINNRLKWFRIPIIIISGLNSVFSVGLSGFIDQDIVSVINCLLSLLCGIISSIELYLKLNENMQIEYEAGKSYSLLHIELSKVLLLRPSDRGIDGIEYLNDVYSKYTSLIRNSQIIIGTILKHDIHVKTTSEKYNNCNSDLRIEIPAATDVLQTESNTTIEMAKSNTDTTENLDE